MAFIEWSDEYNVNIEELNNQHKKLVNIINQVSEATKANSEKRVIRRIFIELAEYTSYHFKFEEELFKTYNYPDFNGHRQRHEKLILQLLDLQMRFRKGALTVSEDMLNFLKYDWLLQHIVLADKEYSAFFNSKGIC